MELSIKDVKEEPLLLREVIIAEGTAASSTPSKAEMQKLIAERLKCSENLIIIRGIKNRFGARRIVVNAYKYKDDESLKKIEPKKKEKKPKVKKVEKND